MNKKAKSLIAYAVVNKNTPKIKFFDIFPDNDVKCAKGEKIIKIKIEEI